MASRSKPLPALRERRVALGHVSLRMLVPAAPGEIIEQALAAELPPARDPTLPYWVEIWPAAVALGRKLLERSLDGLEVIELGAGVGLAGLAAARAGASVLITDNQAEALAVAARNAALNGLEVQTRLLDWCAPAWKRSYDLVIGADLIYERGLVEPLAALVAALLEPRGQALIADPGRPYLAAFTEALEARGLNARLTPTHFFWDAMSRTVTLIHVERATNQRRGGDG